MILKNNNRPWSFLFVKAVALYVQETTALIYSKGGVYLVSRKCLSSELFLRQQQMYTNKGQIALRTLYF